MFLFLYFLSSPIFLSLSPFFFLSFSLSFYFSFSFSLLLFFFLFFSPSIFLSLFLSFYFSFFCLDLPPFQGFPYFSRQERNERKWFKDWGSERFNQILKKGLSWETDRFSKGRKVLETGKVNTIHTIHCRQRDQNRRIGQFSLHLFPYFQT